MKVWNPSTKQYSIYDKFYGRQFTTGNVNETFETFFASLFHSSVRVDDAAQLLETILAEVTKARHILEKSESRMYGASVLIVYEGDTDALDTLLGGGEPKTPRLDERAPTVGELKKVEDEDEDEDAVDALPVAFKVKLIDFAHAEWTLGKGRDHNMIEGLKNVEKQLDALIAKLD
jgi:1D-myo-inositol-tetrakisphosphate 5-kinase/inositol-polyphosphate multikinase